MSSLVLPRLSLAEQREELPRAVLALVKSNNELERRLRVAEAALAGVGVAVPTGPAGGQLGGTYPDPDVRGLRETGGPTELAMGAVADGEVLTRSGSTIVGSAAPTAVDPVTWRGFRQVDPGGAFVNGVTRVHGAGQNAALPPAANYFGQVAVSSLAGVGFTGGKAWAASETFEVDTTVTRLCSRAYSRAGTGGTPRIKMAVYSNTVIPSGTFAGYPYPGALLGQSGDLDPDTAASCFYETSGLSIPIPAGTRVWFVWTCNTQALTNGHQVPVWSAGALPPIMGYTLDTGAAVGVDALAAVAWRHTITYTGSESYPDPFPFTSPTLVTSNLVTVPVVFFGATA